MALLFKRDGDLPKRSLWQRIKDVALTDVAVIARGGVDRLSLEKVEEMMLDADFGVKTTLELVSELDRLGKQGFIKSDRDFLDLLRLGVRQTLEKGNSDPALAVAASGPTVVLVIGVNGAGKTTFIGKLAKRLRDQRRRVLVAAGDTFRAGAIDQLRVWSERVGAEFVGAKPGTDPAAVAFDALDAAASRGMDYVIVDTAGRLHTSGNLMEELKKVVRVIKKRMPDAPHETLLVLDGTIGQNAISQAKTFAEAVPITGLVVTKVDGTARGGIVIAVHEALDVPVKFLGTGEKATDLEPFDATDFATQVLEG
jgi:fused signal recognition particle receptor